MKNSNGSESEGKSFPKGEHPFDYLQEGFTNLSVGCELLEEIGPLEQDDIVRIHKMIDPYIMRITEFYVDILPSE